MVAVRNLCRDDKSMNENCSVYNESMLPARKLLFRVRCRCHTKCISSVEVSSLLYV